MPCAYFPSHIDLACSKLPLTARVSSQFPWPPPPSPVRSDWQRRSNIWPTQEAILRWFYTWDSYSVLFSSSQRDRELKKEGGGKKKNMETRERVLRLFFCAFLFQSTSKECVLVLSVSREVFICVFFFFFEHNFCLLVCWACVSSAGVARTKGIRVACTGGSRETRVICKGFCKG